MKTIRRLLLVLLAPYSGDCSEADGRAVDGVSLWSCLERPWSRGWRGGVAAHAGRKPTEHTWMEGHSDSVAIVTKAEEEEVSRRDED